MCSKLLASFHLSTNSSLMWWMTSVESLDFVLVGCYTSWWYWRCWSATGGQVILAPGMQQRVWGYPISRHVHSSQWPVCMLHIWEGADQSHPNIQCWRILSEPTETTLCISCGIFHSDLVQYIWACLLGQTCLLGLLNILWFYYVGQESDSHIGVWVWWDCQREWIESEVKVHPLWVMMLPLSGDFALRKQGR